MFGIDNVREYIERFNCELISNTYKNAKTKIDIRCSCGEIFNVTYDGFKNSKLKKCKKCVSECASKRISLTIEYVKMYVNNNSKCELISKEYISSGEKLIFKCHCGNEFEQSFDVFRNGSKKQCPKCSIEQNTLRQRFNQEEAEKIAYENGNKLIGRYINYHTKTEFLCSCGKVITTTLARVSTSKGIKCRECNNEKLRQERIIPIDEVKAFIKCKGCEFIEGEYINNTSKLSMRCNCGQVFTTDFASFRSGKQFCDFCGMSISRGERYTIKALEDLGVEFVREYRFEDCRMKRTLPFDFYLPKLNTCIEYHGIQHYKESRNGWGKKLSEQQRYDKAKEEYCKENDIKLIVIPYWTKKENIKRFIERRI